MPVDRHSRFNEFGGHLWSLTDLTEAEHNVLAVIGLPDPLAICERCVRLTRAPVLTGLAWISHVATYGFELDGRLATHPRSNFDDYLQYLSSPAPSGVQAARSSLVLKPHLAGVGRFVLCGSVVAATKNRLTRWLWKLLNADDQEQHLIVELTGVVHDRFVLCSACCEGTFAPVFGLDAWLVALSRERCACSRADGTCIVTCSSAGTR